MHQINRLIANNYFEIESLFDSLPDVVFFIKDRDGCYAAVNATLVRRSGATEKSALIGKTPSEALGPELGAGYERQDQAVLKTGEPIINQLELHVYVNHAIGWCLTNKRALRDDSGAFVGIAGISQDLPAPAANPDSDDPLRRAMEYADQNLSEPPSIQKLADIAGLSPYQLDRRMRSVTGLTTGQWVLKQRLDHARRQLQHSDAPIAEIALNAGYRDQSAFSRQFLRATGLTPSAFRKTRPA